MIVKLSKSKLINKSYLEQFRVAFENFLKGNLYLLIG